MYDAIVVGARCAGSPTAMLLARQGHRVLLVDRSSFPSDTLSTHYIHQPGVACLRRWGVVDAVEATGCPPITQLTLDVGPFALVGSPVPFEGVAHGLAPRRQRLDTILAEAAVAAGAELRERFVVEEIVMDDGRVTGIRGRSGDGPSVTETARVVIGADGRFSSVQRAVEAPEYRVVPPLTCGYYSYFSGVPCPGAELYPRDGRFIIVFPTNDDLTMIAVQWLAADFHAFRADLERNFLATLELAPSLAERVRGGRREERFQGAVMQPNYFRRPFGPGWALVGDAGFHQDPNTGHGITDAFRDAELVAEAVDTGLAGRADFADALANYERRRNERAAPIFDMTIEQASLLPPPPEKQQLLAALRGNQPDTDQFFGTAAGAVPIPEFFAEANVGRILAAAGGVPA